MPRPQPAEPSPEVLRTRVARRAIERLLEARVLAPGTEALARQVLAVADLAHRSPEVRAKVRELIANLHTIVRAEASTEVTHAVH